MALSVGKRHAVIVGLAVVALAVLAFFGSRFHLVADGPQSGSWWFPRGGPYILGFDSPSQGTARLEIDGKTVAEGTGQKTERVIFQEGAHAFSLSGPPGTRLLWHPPGRRGAPEYVSPSSLSADPPATARFTTPGTDSDAALVAGAMLLVLVLAGMALARPFADRRVALIAFAIFAVAIAIRAWNISGAGQTWDEDEYWSSGRNYIINILRGDFGWPAWRWNYQHPPITKYLAGIGALGQDGFDAARVLFAIVGAAICPLAYLAARRLVGETGAILGAIICAFTPHLIGHAHVVGHETPSVFFWGLAIWLGLRAGELPSPVRLMWVGVACGLAVATRYTNLLVLPAAGTAILMTAAPPFRRRVIGLGALIIPAAMIATFVAVWPGMWSHPIEHLKAGWQILGHQHLPETYLGHEEQTPPWHYFPLYVAVSTPIVVLVLALGGGIGRAWRRRERGWILVAVWLVAPFGVAFSPVRQDGVRYVLPALVPLAIAAGAGLAWLVEKRRAILAVTAGALVVYLAIVCARIEPYYIDYFAEQVGGPATVQAHGWFETGWWGEGIADAVTWLNEHAEDGSSVARMVQPNHVTWLRGDLWAKMSDTVRADTGWILVNDEWIDTMSPSWQPPAGAELVYDVRIEGASLARVYRRKVPTRDELHQ